LDDPLFDPSSSKKQCLLVEGEHALYILHRFFCSAALSPKPIPSDPHAAFKAKTVKREKKEIKVKGAKENLVQPPLHSLTNWYFRASFFQIGPPP
jgi:hypothetical protein